MVLDYLKKEMKDKKKQDLNTDDWERACPDVPQQENTWDCGVFTCKFGDYASRRARFDFSQSHMDYFRKRMVCEIVKQTLCEEEIVDPINEETEAEDETLRPGVNKTLDESFGERLNLCLL